MNNPQATRDMQELAWVRHVQALDKRTAKRSRKAQARHKRGWVPYAQR